MNKIAHRVLYPSNVIPVIVETDFEMVATKSR